MTRMNWDRVNRENRAISEANRTLDPVRTYSGTGKKRSNRRKKSKRMTEKERALAWHRQNRAMT